MKKIISNKQVFQCLKNTFAVTLPEGSYELFMSVDGTNFTKYPEAINGNDTLVVNGCTPMMYFYISGLSNDVVVLL